jgi:hypothetical protein
MDAICERRIRYVKAGYEPIPCVGKRPVLANWPEALIDVDAPAIWNATYPGATDTGIRTKRTPAADIDIYDVDMADRIENELHACFPQQLLLVRIGQAPKRLIPFRCETPFSKIMVRFKAPNDEKTVHKIEVLGDGQQFIADGVHPDTGKAYTWQNGDLLSVPHEHLPPIDEATARRFIARAREIIIAAGWTEMIGKKGNGKTSNKTNDKAHSTIYGRTALKNESAALATMPKDSGRNDTLNCAAFNMFQLVKTKDLNENLVRTELFAAAKACGLVAEDGAAQVRATIESGARAGRARPRQERVHEEEEEEVPPILRSARASTFEISAIQWLWSNRFALGKLGILAGLPDEGKGQVLCDMAARVTRGLDWPCGEGTAPQGNVVLLTAEDDPKDTVVPRLIAAGADLDRIEIVQMVHEAGKDRMFSLVSDLDLLRQTVLRVGNVNMIQIDPITAYLGVKQIDSFRTTDVRAVLGPVTDLASELMVSIVGIMHFNKKIDVTNPLLRISDSLAFGATARHVYAVVDDPENKRKLLVKGKNNLARHDNKALAYGFGAREVGKDKKTGKEIWAPHVVWYSQHIEVTATEAMQAAGGQSGYARRDAREFLLNRLEAGPVNADDILEEAKHNGISQKTLKRAKKDLNIRSVRGEDNWFWELPAKPRTVADP